MIRRSFRPLRHSSTWFFTTAILVSGSHSAVAATITTSDSGIKIDGGTMGTFELSYPKLEDEGHNAPHKLVDKTSDGQTATLHYDGGGTVTVSTADANHVTLAFAQMPDDVKYFFCHMSIPIAYAQGGQWQIKDKSGAFPGEKPPGPKLFQGQASAFLLTNYDGASLHFGVPQYSYEELQDDREWNNAQFEWMFTSPLNPNAGLISLPIGSGPLDGNVTTAAGQSATYAPHWDEFGQLNQGTWANKVNSDDDLKADVAADDAYYGALKPPVYDEYGGLPGSGAKFGLTATGYFHPQKAMGKWVLVDPDGNAFFQLGVCDLQPLDDATLIRGRETAFAKLPPADGDTANAYRKNMGGGVVSFHLANMERKFGTSLSADDFMTRTVDRVRRWGFNSGGAFSMISPVETAAHFPYVGSLPLDQWTAGIQEIPGVSRAWDPFDPDNAAKVDAVLAKNLPQRADDPCLIGYFLTNEPLYEDVPKVVPTLKGKYACKQRLVKFLSDKYGTIDAFNTAWGLTAATFDELNDEVLVPKTKEADADMHAYTGLFLDVYFKLVTDDFHKYDTHHLLIGNRVQPRTINDEQLCAISGKYMDVISFNYYTDALDTEFLDRVHAWTGDKPMLLSEFFWASGSDSGLTGGPAVASQQERGLAYRNYVENATSLGYVVGIEWFTLVDEPASGRFFEGFNGERANSGLLSVADRPWKPMLDEMMKTNYRIYDVWLGGAKPFVFDNPRFTKVGALHQEISAPRATGPITLDGTTSHWPGIPPERISGQRLVAGTDPAGFDATYRLCWDQDNLYVLATVDDPTPMLNDQAAPDLWNGDAVELFVGSENLDQGGSYLYSDRQIMLGAGKGAKFFYNHAPEQYPTNVTVVPGVDGKSYTLEAAIPWTSLSVTPKPGTELLFDLVVDDGNGHNRTRQIAWNGTDKDSVERTHWGRLKLAE